MFHVCPQAANAQRRTLESEVKIRTSAMESFDQMNSSLISANLGLQVAHLTQAPPSACLTRFCSFSQDHIRPTSQMERVANPLVRLFHVSTW